jgi:hypothetical protein
MRSWKHLQSQAAAFQPVLEEGVALCKGEPQPVSAFDIVKIFYVNLAAAAAHW